mgnify:FL=1
MKKWLCVMLAGWILCGCFSASWGEDALSEDVWAERNEPWENGPAEDWNKGECDFSQQMPPTETWMFEDAAIDPWMTPEAEEANGEQNAVQQENAEMAGAPEEKTLQEMPDVGSAPEEGNMPQSRFVTVQVKNESFRKGKVWEVIYTEDQQMIFTWENPENLTWQVDITFMDVEEEKTAVQTTVSGGEYRIYMAELDTEVEYTLTVNATGSNGELLQGQMRFMLVSGEMEKDVDARYDEPAAAMPPMEEGPELPPIFVDADLSGEELSGENGAEDLPPEASDVPVEMSLENGTEAMEGQENEEAEAFEEDPIGEMAEETIGETEEEIIGETEEETATAPSGGEAKKASPAKSGGGKASSGKKSSRKNIAAAPTEDVAEAEPIDLEDLIGEHLTALMVGNEKLSLGLADEAATFTVELEGTVLRFIPEADDEKTEWHFSGQDIVKLKKTSLTRLVFQINGHAYTVNLVEEKEEGTAETNGSITASLADVVWKINKDGMSVQVNGVYLFGVDE